MRTNRESSKMFPFTKGIDGSATVAMPACDSSIATDDTRASFTFATAKWMKCGK